MACSYRANRHGYLAIRVYWQGNESHEGTALKATAANEKKVAARVATINDEMEDGSFDYLKWFPDGAIAHRFRPAVAANPTTTLTLRGFYQGWGGPDAETAEQKQNRPVSTKWALNRASAIKANVLPHIGSVRLDELTPAILTDLQQKLLRSGLKPATVDGVVHSALRGMLRDAKSAGYRVADLQQLYDKQFIRRLNLGSDPSTIDAFTDEERDKIIEGFRGTNWFPFVMHQFWTGARPSEAIGLRWRSVDLAKRVIRIRVSRVHGKDGTPKTGKSKRDVVIHGNLLDVLKQMKRGEPDDFVFTTTTGVAISQDNFYRRHWVPKLEELGIRVRDFYQCRHTYISSMLAKSVNPVTICRQTGTSLDMILGHYGCARTMAAELDEVIGVGARVTNAQAA